MCLREHQCLAPRPVHRVFLIDSWVDGRPHVVPDELAADLGRVADNGGLVGEDGGVVPVGLGKEPRGAVEAPVVSGAALLGQTPSNMAR